MEASFWDPEGVDTLLDADGRLTGPLELDAFDPKRLYKLLVTARALDLRLARVGIPMHASSAGEEAPVVASALLAQPQDWIYPGVRDIALGLVRGLEHRELLEQALALPHSETQGRSQPGTIASARLRIAPPTDALGLQLAIAAGEAHGQKLEQRGGITIALFGEGLTTTGAFHETIALAVACDLPLVFVCKSQLWPEAAPAEAGLLGDAVSERVKACGMWTRRVDGADPLAVSTALSAAYGRARSGRGPALVEAVVTHQQKDVPAHRDPVERMRRFLDREGLWTPTLQDVIEAEIRGHLDAAFKLVQESHS